MGKGSEKERITLVRDMECCTGEPDMPFQESDVLCRYQEVIKD